MPRKSSPEHAAFLERSTGKLDRLRADWPRKVSWAEVRTADPGVFRSAAFGALVLPLFALLACCLSGFSFEFPDAIVLPEPLEWARGLLTVVSLWGTILTGILAAILLSRPIDLRRGGVKPSKQQPADRKLPGSDQYWNGGWR
jgi:hypothetical protein